MKLLAKALQMLPGGERMVLGTGEVLSREDMVDAGARLYETPDPVPKAPPVGYKREMSIMERIRGELLKDKVERLRQELGAETPEEAEDFDVEDDEDYQPSSEWEFERHDQELLQAYERLQMHRLAMDAKYGTTTADVNVDAAAKKAADAKAGGAGGKPPAEGAKAPEPSPEGGESTGA